MCAKIYFSRRIKYFLLISSFVSYQCASLKSFDPPDDESRNLEELYDVCWKIRSSSDYYAADPRCDNFAYDLLPERPPGHCVDYGTQTGVDYNTEWYQVCKDWVETYGTTTSQSPSMAPTSAPSRHPSAVPTGFPTESPTKSPSTTPTLPRVTMSPSHEPSLNPSLAPTEAPKMFASMDKFTISLRLNDKRLRNRLLNDANLDEDLFQTLNIFLTKKFTERFVHPTRFYSLILEMEATKPEQNNVIETIFSGNIIFYLPKTMEGRPTRDGISQVVVDIFKDHNTIDFISLLRQSSSGQWANATSVDVQLVSRKSIQITNENTAKTGNSNKTVYAAAGVVVSGIGLITVLVAYSCRQKKSRMIQKDWSNEIPRHEAPIKNETKKIATKEVEDFQHLDDESLCSNKSSLFSISIRSTGVPRDSLCFSEDTDAYISETSTCRSDFDTSSQYSKEPSYLDFVLHDSRGIS